MDIRIQKHKLRGIVIVIVYITIYDSRLLERDVVMTMTSDSFLMKCFSRIKITAQKLHLVTCLCIYARDTLKMQYIWYS